MQRQQEALCDPGKQSRAENHRGEALSQALLGQQSFPKEGDGQVKMWRMEGPWEECLGQRQWLGRRVNLARLENLEWMSEARMLCLRYGSGWRRRSYTGGCWTTAGPDYHTEGNLLSLCNLKAPRTGMKSWAAWWGHPGMWTTEGQELDQWIT